MGSGSERRARRASWLVVTAIATAGVACAVFSAGGREADTPEKAFHRVNAALQRGDWAALYEAAASPSTRRLFDADLERVRKELAATGGDELFAESVLGVTTEEYHRMDAAELFVATSQARGKPAKLLVMVPDRDSMRNAEVVGTEIDGDEATLQVKLANGARPVEMIREDGRWYFQLVNTE